MMTAALFDTARMLAGFVLGYATARTPRPCPICGQPAATITGLCHLCAPIIHPGKETR